MQQGVSIKLAILGTAATLTLGVLLPVMIALATKSSPLFLGIAALLSFAAFASGSAKEGFKTALLQLKKSISACVAFGLFAFMVVSVSWAHNTTSSANQLVQFIVPVVSGLLLAVFFPAIASRKRVLAWVCALAVAAIIMIVDIRTGLKLREITGGRMTDYSYNRTIVTLMVVLWPVLALLVARKQLYVAVLLLPLPLAVWIGESGASVLALLIGLLVFPIAQFLPVLSRQIGLGATILIIALSPFIGTLSKLVLGQTFHKTFESAHSSDRVDIWLSFEAVVHKKWLLGNGFGSSLNLQNAAVAKLIPPEKVMLLGASHPHNAFLQVWVELGLVGAAFTIALTLLLFRAVGKANPLIQPFLLTWIAVVAGVSLVSHGAWQAWWIAAIAASAVGFLALEHELKQDAAG